MPLGPPPERRPRPASLEMRGFPVRDDQALMSGSKPGSLAITSRVWPEERPAMAWAVWMIGSGQETSRLSSTSSARVVVPLLVLVAVFIDSPGVRIEFPTSLSEINTIVAPGLPDS